MTSWICDACVKRLNVGEIKSVARPIPAECAACREIATLNLAVIPPSSTTVEGEV